MLIQANKLSLLPACNNVKSTMHMGIRVCDIGMS